MSDKLKWLLLIPVIIAAVTVGYLVPRLIGSGNDNGSPADGQQTRAPDLEISETQKTIDSYLGLLEKNPADMDALRGLGDAYLEMGSMLDDDYRQNEAFSSYKSSVDYYRKYLAVKPDDREIRVDLGLAYFHLKMPEIAERELQAVTKADPHNQRAWHSLGWVLSTGLGKTKEAKAAWEASYSLDPNSAIGQESRQFLDRLISQQ